MLQGGWAGQLIGIDTETPMPAFIPVLMFAVLIGLSMDYEVFLISRMRESWLRTNGNGNRAVVDGLAGTGRVITAAAAITVAVFAAFIPSPGVILKVIGVGMRRRSQSTPRCAAAALARRCTVAKCRRHKRQRRGLRLWRGPVALAADQFAAWRAAAAPTAELARPPYPHPWAVLGGA